MKNLISQTLEIQIIRFGIVGVVNTLVDVLIFSFLRFSGLHLVIANILSTSIALGLSLLLNYRFTFKQNKLTKKQIVLYILVTIIGLWVLQPIIISLALRLNEQFLYVEFFTGFLGRQEVFETIVPKLISIGFTLVWNYCLYSKLVFGKNQRLN